MAASARSLERGRESGPRERAVSERGTGELGRSVGGVGREAARGAELGRASAMAGRAPVHGCHDAFSLNTWRARWSPTWSPFLAYSVHIWTLAPVSKLLYSGCSTNLIKAAWSLELFISR